MRASLQLTDLVAALDDQICRFEVRLWRRQTFFVLGCPTHEDALYVHKPGDTIKDRFTMPA